MNGTRAGRAATTPVWMLLAWMAAVSSTASASATSHTEWIALGTQGGPRINSVRAQPANLLTVNGVHYLFDAGNGVARQLALANIPATSVGHIFITHNHDDHDADWGTLMGLEWSLGRSEPMEVIGPRGTESMLLGFEQYFLPNVANRTLKGAKEFSPETVFHAHDIEQEGLVYKDDNIQVTAHENCHFHYSPGQPGYEWQKSYSYRIQTPDKTIVYMGDTGECGAELTEFVRGASILVDEVIDLAAVEASMKNDRSVQYRADQMPALMEHMRTEHSTPETVGKLAAAANVGMVILTHLVPGSDQLPDSAYSDGVRQFFKGPVVVAKDLQRFD